MLTTLVLSLAISQTPADYLPETSTEAIVTNREAADTKTADSKYKKLSIAGRDARSFQAIHDDIRAAMKIESTSRSEVDRAAAIVKLTVLHREIMLHPRYEDSDTLKEYRAKVWSRLTRVKKELKRQADRQGGSRTVADPELAKYEKEDAKSSAGASSNQLAGKVAAGRAGGRPIRDHGQELIDLIERTINPEFWENNGGPGTIFYFQPLHALVVRATAETHENLADILQQLRRAQ